MWKRFITDFFLNIFFPEFCFSCKREGNYLCQDCLATIDILESSFCLCQSPQRMPSPGKCRRCRGKNLNGLYFPVSYKNKLVKKLILKFKYEPYVKKISENLSLLIITHLNLIQKTFDAKEHLLIPVPLSKKRMRQRGFNQSEEIAKILSENLEIPVLKNCLLKTKETLPQMELSQKEREKNIRNAFYIKNSDALKNKKVLLVDDVYTTGCTMEECARILKEAGAREVWGVIVAREE